MNKSFNIRKYDEEKDFIMLSSWWISSGMNYPDRNMIPSETTYIVEYNSIPMVSGCLYLMNCKGASMIENIIGNPFNKCEERKECLELLIKHLESIAKEKGYTQLVIFSYEDKVKERYKNLGFKETMSNITTFAKEVI